MRDTVFAHEQGWSRFAPRILGYEAALLLVFVSLGSEAQSPRTADSPETPNSAAAMRGFSSPHAARERELEQKLLRIPSPESAERHLRFLTSSPHMAGTEGSRRVAEYLRNQLRSYGFEAELVTYRVWMPQPSEVKLELVAPEEKALATPEEPFEQGKDSYDPRAIVAFNSFSPSGEVTAPVVYVNYGMVEDYRRLEELNISVQGKIVLARYGRGYRGVKAKVAEENKAAALILYSDPADDGYVAGDPYPRGPWRPMSAIQRGSILYTFVHPGDPLTPDAPATREAKPLDPAQAKNLPHIPTLPISPHDAAEIIPRLGGPRVPRDWQGGLPFSYHIGPGEAVAHLKLAMNYQQRTIYDVIAKLRGENDDEWVVLGNHHDAWVFGAADPSSGTAAMLETARALGELARTGWKPRRSILICHWDGEEFGLMGSTKWVEERTAELQRKAVAYLNLDTAVSGSAFGGAGTPSLRALVRDATREVADPRTGRSVYEVWKEAAQKSRGRSSAVTAGQTVPGDDAPVGKEAEPPMGNLGAGSDFVAFFHHAGIPALDISSGGDYGVYHSLFDDFYWMKTFGDPSFAYHAEMARITGIVALRLAQADVVPFDYEAYAAEIFRYLDELDAVAKLASDSKLDLARLRDAASTMKTSATRVRQALEALGSAPLDAARAATLNRKLVEVEQALLAPQGLAGRPWYRHTIYAPGTYSGYSAVIFPGVREALSRKDYEGARREAAALEDALRRAAARLDEVAKLSAP